MCFVWISEQTAIISLYNINRLVFITETECVYCAVRTGCLYIIHTNLSISSVSHSDGSADRTSSNDRIIKQFTGPRHHPHSVFLQSPSVPAGNFADGTSSLATTASFHSISNYKFPVLQALDTTYSGLLIASLNNSVSFIVSLNTTASSQGKPTTIGASSDTCHDQGEP